MNLKKIILNEMKQLQDIMYCIITNYMEYLDQANRERQKVDQWCPRVKAEVIRGSGDPVMMGEALWGMMKML